jgi:hypothetical protein
MKPYIDNEEAWRLVRICDINGLSHKSSWSVVNAMKHWEVHKGMKWVVNRLKLLRQDILVKDQAVRKDSNGAWKGQFRPIWYLAQRGRRGLRNALRICSMYGRFEERIVTRRDFLNFKSSIDLAHDYTVPVLKISHEDRWLANESIQQAKYNLRYDRSNVKSSIGLDVFPHKTRFYPCYRTNNKRRSEIDPTTHLLALNDCPKLVLKHYDYLSTLFVLADVYHYDRLRMARHHNCVVGSISALTKDRGLKIRFVANPAYLLQVATSRLQAGLDEFLRSMPESCVHDQARGPIWIQEQFRLKKSISSIDLSQCTDNLPAREQFSMLRSLFGYTDSLREEINLFESIARAEWSTPYDSLFMRWTKGQPLGTNPSFASFTIFHILLVRSIGGTAANFRVIGDDIIISDDNLTDKVLMVYSDMRVSVSVHKSIFKHRRFAEFAGRLVDQHGIIPVYKASPLKISSDPMGYIRQYGFKALELLPKRVRLIVSTVASLPPPIGMGPLKMLTFLPGEVAYYLYSDHFKPVVGSSSTDALKRWKSAFKSPIIPDLDMIEAGFEVAIIYSDAQSTERPLGDSEWDSPSKEMDDFSGTVRCLEDHVRSFAHVPVVEVPQQIQELGEILERVSDPAIEFAEDKYDPEPKKTISWVRRIFKFLRGILSP